MGLMKDEDLSPKSQLDEEASVKVWVRLQDCMCAEQKCSLASFNVCRF